MKFLAITGGVLGLLGVLLGAFGAHSIESLVSAARLDVWKTAVSYQLYHVPVLLMTALLSERGAGKWRYCAGLGFLTGIAIFSGSLYLLVLFDLPKLGMVTPIGGVMLIVAWICLLVAIARNEFTDQGK